MNVIVSSLLSVSKLNHRQHFSTICAKHHLLCPPKRGNLPVIRGGERALTLHFCKRWTLYSCRGWVLYIAAENMRQGLDGEHQSPVLQNILLQNKLCPLDAEIEVGRRWMKEVFMSISPGFLSDIIQIFVQFYRRNLWKESHVWVFEGNKSSIFFYCFTFQVMPGKFTLSLYHQYHN